MDQAIEKTLLQAMTAEKLDLSDIETGVQDVDSALKNLSEVAVVSLKNTTAQKVSDSLLVSGNGTFWTIENSAVEIRFSQQNKTIIVSVTASPPANWKIEDSFPDVPADPFLDSVFLYQLDIENPQFSLLSPTQGQPYAIDLSVTAGLTGPLEILNNWFEADALDFAGPVSVDGENIQVTLVAKSSFNSAFGPIQLKPSQLCVTAPLAKNSDSLSSIKISSEVEFGETLSIPVTGELYLASDIPARLSASLENKSLPDLSGLISSFDSSLTSHFPEDLLQLNDLSISRIYLDILPTNLTLVELGLSLEKTGSSWTIVPEHLSLEDLSFDLQLLWPTQAWRRELLLKAYAGSQFLGANFEATASLPGPTLYASMDRETTFPIGKLFSTFLPKNLTDLPTDLEITDLFVSVDGNSRQFYFDGGLSGSLSLPLKIRNEDVRISDPHLTLRANLNDISQAEVGFRGTVLVGDVGGEINTSLSLAGMHIYCLLPPLSLRSLASDLLGSAGALPDLQLEQGHISSSVINKQLALDVGGTLSSDLSLPIGNSSISVDYVSVALGSKDKKVFAHLQGAGGLGSTRLTIDCDVSDGLSLGGTINEINLPVLASDLFSVEKTSIPDIAIKGIAFSADSQGKASFSADKIDADVDFFAKQLGLELPMILPNPKLQNLQITIGDSSHLSIESGVEIPLVQSLAAKKFAFGMDFTDSGTALTLGCAIQGEVELAEGCALQLDIQIRGVAGGNKFAAEGSATLNLYGNTYQLLASFTDVNNQQCLQLKYDGTLSLIDWPNLAKLNLDSLILQMRQNQDGEREWHLISSGSLNIEGVLSTSVTLSIEKDHDKGLIKMQAHAPKISPIALPAWLPNKTPTIGADIHELEIIYQSGDSETSNAGLSLAASSLVKFSDFEPLENLIPSELDGDIRVTSHALTINCAIPAQWQPALPEWKLEFSNGKKISLGRPGVTLASIGIELSSATPTLTSKLHVTMPDHINEALHLDLFEQEFDLQLDIGKQLTLKPLPPKWPIKNIGEHTYTKEVNGEDKEWLKWKSAAGDLGIQIPEFSFKAGSWSVAIGMERLGEIGIPLQLLKTILSECGLGALTSVIPDRMPLKGLNLNASDLSAELEQLMGKRVLEGLDTSVREALESAVEAIQGATDRLPSILRDEYLSLEIPESFTLAIDVRPGGSTSAHIKTSGAPIKLLLPNLSPPIPSLMGVTLREIGVGQILGGQLLSIRFDGHIDQFDLVSLIACMATGEGESIRHRIHLEKTLSFMPTGTPVILPIFYDHVGMDHQDILGFELQSHWYLPEPELEPMDFVALASSLIKFFTDSEYFLHEEGHMPEAFSAPLTIGENYLKLPEYLGGTALGFREKLPEYDLVQSVAFILDSIKDLNPAFAIQAVPLYIPVKDKREWLRVNQIDINFGPININAGWCVATGEEFTNNVMTLAVEDGKFDAKNLEDVLQAVPTKARQSDRAFVVLLMGGWDCASIVGMSAQFGIAYTRENGFQTGFRLAGTLGGCLELCIYGYFGASSQVVEIEGGASLQLNDENLISAKTKVQIFKDPSAFNIECALAIGKLNLDGAFFVSSARVALSGEMSWPYAEGQEVRVQAEALFNSAGVEMTFDCQIFIADCSVMVSLPASTAKIVVNLEGGIQEQFKHAIVGRAKKEVNQELDSAYKELNNALDEIDGLEVNVRDIRKAIPGFCKKINERIDSEIEKQVIHNTKGIKIAGRPAAMASAKSKAKPYKEAISKLGNAAANGSVNAEKLQQVAEATLKQCNKKMPVIQRKPLTDGQVKRIKDLVDKIHFLDSNKKIRIDKGKIVDKYTPLDKIFSQIRQSVNKGIEDGFPTIESVEAELDVHQFLSKKISAHVVYRMGGKNSKKVQVDIDLSNPAATAVNAASMFSA